MALGDATARDASSGDAEGGSEEFFSLAYDELRRLARSKLARESPGHTLQATALVHEAYVRLSGADSSGVWRSRGHFFAAAAEAMRRILVESARGKKTAKRGGGYLRVEFNEADLGALSRPSEVLALDDALASFEAVAPQKAALVKLRFFAGLTGKEAAEMLGLSVATADRQWAYARAWLQREMSSDGPPS